RLIKKKAPCVLYTGLREQEPQNFPKNRQERPSISWDLWETAFLWKRPKERECSLWEAALESRPCWKPQSSARERRRSLQDTGIKMCSFRKSLKRRENLSSPQKTAAWEQKAMLWMLSGKTIWKQI